MKIGIIDIGWKEFNKDNISKEALGGSETWLISVSVELQKLGHQVDVYCNTKEMFIYNYINFIPHYYMIDHFQQNNNQALGQYDFVILNRIIYRYNTDIISLIRQYNITDNIFIQMHDLSMLYEDHLITEEELKHTGIHDPRVRGFVFLTEWHMNNFYAQYPSLKDIPCFIIPNGLDWSFFNQPIDKSNADNRILWSSCAERGLDILIDMYDNIKKEVPDFGIDVAGYNDLTRINTKGKDVKILGNLNKEQLYQEMSKHKVWFYPGTFAETFCITMIENMACGNIVVSPFTYGTRDVVGTYKDAVWQKYGPISTFTDKWFNEAKEEATAAIINVLKNYDKDVSCIGQETVKKYTWKETAKHYIGLYNTLRHKKVHTDIKKYKGIFLSQSANINFFKRESEVVEETWAKDLIDNKYSGYTYFRYTACDNDHPSPCIDGHVIYVNNDDKLEHTYEKMRDAYRTLLDYGYDFDYIFRTNTSTYINVKKAIEAIESTKSNEIKSDICGYYYLMSNNTRIFQFNCFIGNAYIMSKYLADRAFLSRYDSSIRSVPDGDDIVTNSILNELSNPGEIVYVELNHTGKEKENRCMRYKHLIEPEYETDPEHTTRYTEDPNVVNNEVCVSVRVKSLDYGDRVKYGEYEHMKELHKAYKKEER